MQGLAPCSGSSTRLDPKCPRSGSDLGRFAARVDQPLPKGKLRRPAADLNVKNGGRTWARTKDPLIKSQLLYQLSYASVPSRKRPYSDCCVAAKPSFGGPYNKLPPPCLPHRSTAMIVPMQIMLVIIEEPPWLMNGSGMPTTGASPMTIIRLMQT